MIAKDPIWVWPAFRILAVVYAGVVVVYWVAAVRHWRRSVPEPSGPSELAPSKLTPYEVAILSSGPRAAVSLAIAKLMVEGALQEVPSKSTRHLAVALSGDPPVAWSQFGSPWWRWRAHRWPPPATAADENQIERDVVEALRHKVRPWPGKVSGVENTAPFTGCPRLLSTWKRADVSRGDAVRRIQARLANAGMMRSPFDLTSFLRAGWLLTLLAGAALVGWVVDGSNLLHPVPTIPPVMDWLVLVEMWMVFCGLAWFLAHLPVGAMGRAKGNGCTQCGHMAVAAQRYGVRDLVSTPDPEPMTFVLALYYEVLGRSFQELAELARDPNLRNIREQWSHGEQLACRYLTTDLFEYDDEFWQTMALGL